jgi:endonuclease/exonuclease/phosphatase family metal-dependent hydrolase
MIGKRLFILLILLFISFFICAQDIKVMSYNIRLNLESDGENAWDHRKEFLCNQIQFFEPDIFGVQEALPEQVKDMKERLPQYSYTGEGRDGNNSGEASGIFFKKDRFILKQGGTFWLSDTPDTISTGWDAAYRRVCTYALFYDNRKKRMFWMFNTHLDHKGELARTKGIELIIKKIDSLNNNNYPVILTGDFNSEPNSARIQYIKTKMLDSREISIQKPFGPRGTFNSFKYNEPVELLIDYIFISKNSPFIVNKYAVLTDSKNLRFPSDHFPVFVELKFK